MCLLVLAWQAHPRYRLVVAANRDEFHARAAAPLARWPPPADILAGRDLQAQGTWLGLDRARRFGVVTNFRELQRPQPQAPSRGGLIPRYLGGTEDAAAFFAALEPEAARYSGFNLLLTDARELWYGSNRAAPFARALRPGRLRAVERAARHPVAEADAAYVPASRPGCTRRPARPRSCSPCSPTAPRLRRRRPTPAGCRRSGRGRCRPHSCCTPVTARAAPACCCSGRGASCS